MSMQDFAYVIEWDGRLMSRFSEASGLPLLKSFAQLRETDLLDLGTFIDSPAPADRIIMRRGEVRSGRDFCRWLSRPEDVIVYQVDESREPVMFWKVRNAFPVKVEGQLEATGKEVGIEYIEIAFEDVDRR